MFALYLTFTLKALKATYMKKSLKRLLTAVAALAFLVVPMAAQETVPVFRNTSYSFEERAVDLVSRLTLEEKQALLGTTTKICCLQ